MAFLGDRTRSADPRALAREVRRALDAARASPPGTARHAALAGALVAAGELAQGLADAERARDGADADGPLAAASMAGLGAIARALWRSFRATGRAPVAAAAPGALAAAHLPETIRIRAPEGYAFYALYPEAYALAGGALLGAGALAVGIRSVGTGLAAMVAAGAGARRRPVTVRPVGDPFAREVALAPALAARLARHPGPFAVADEGPGLSGSSFAAVARALEGLGVPARRIHLFPSHGGGPGPRGRPEDRARWAALPRHVASADAFLLGDGPLSIRRLAEDAIGPADGPPEELSAGAWRARLALPPGSWPPSTGWMERRKVLVRAGGRAWVARFAGLGAAGEARRARADALAAAGLALPAAALRHGFLFEPWRDDARPWTVAGAPRARLLAAARRHVAFVARAFPAGPADGASPAALLAMARENAAAALGREAGEALRRLEDALPDLSREARPVACDGKMQAWEWLVLGDGSIAKADALDHHAAHDLAGCQDALWDVAGAWLELGLSRREALALAEAVRGDAPGADPRHLGFYRACLAALELGRWEAAGSLGGASPEEAARRGREVARYAAALRAEVARIALG